MSPTLTKESVIIEGDDQRFKRHQTVSPQLGLIPTIYNDFDDPVCTFSHTDSDVEIT